MHNVAFSTFTSKPSLYAPRNPHAAACAVASPFVRCANGRSATMKFCLAMAILGLTAGSIPNAGETDPEQAHPDCRPGTLPEVEAAERAFRLALPLYEVWRTRQRMLSQPGMRTNRLLHRTTLSQPRDRSITMPNTDTLYSTAWLDLAGGPQRLTIPAMGSRYHSVELMHPFTDAFAILRNEEQRDTRDFLIVGPDWNGKARPQEIVIRSPTRDVWLVARTFVAGTSDLAQAQRLQGAYSLSGDKGADGGTTTEVGAPIPARPNGSQFVAIVNAALARGPIPRGHAERLDCLALTLGWEATTPFAPRIDPAMGAVFDRHLSRLYDETSRALKKSGVLRHGWRYPQSNIAAFGSDDAYRSAIALGGLAALPVSEAINPLTSEDSDGVPFVGSSRYRLVIPKDVPVDAFWSLTLYESDGTGRWFLYKNSIGRYSVTSLTNDIKTSADGTIVVNISHEEPGDRTNWLPAPSGHFLLVFRAYRPRASVADGSFSLPAVIRVEAD